MATRQHPQVVTIDEGDGPVKVVKDPGGRVISVPAFFDQDFVPLQEGTEVRAVPVGPGRWKVRFRATRSGRHKIALSWAGQKFADLPVTVGPPRRRRRGGGGLVRTDVDYLQSLTTVGGESRLPTSTSHAGASFSGMDAAVKPLRMPSCRYVAQVTAVSRSESRVPSSR